MLLAAICYTHLSTHYFGGWGARRVRGKAKWGRVEDSRRRPAPLEGPLPERGVFFRPYKDRMVGGGRSAVLLLIVVRCFVAWPVPVRFFLVGFESVLFFLFLFFWLCAVNEKTHRRLFQVLFLNNLYFGVSCGSRVLQLMSLEGKNPCRGQG